jgi:myosin tail region-interacting protein MTI1
VKTVPLLAAAFVVGLCVIAIAEKPTSMGDRIVAFCKHHKGKRVGSGECSALAEAAMRSAGAQPHGWGDRSRGVDERFDDYNWGELIYSLEREGTNFKSTGQLKSVRPGDIIQYRDVELAGQNDDGYYRASAKHHTAVVSGVEGDGMLRIYHQNFNGRRVVMADRLRLGDLQQGRLSIYHPIPRARRQSDE